MADLGSRGKALKELLAIAKKRELAFAYCPGGRPKDDVFILHRTKKPEVIGREARGASEGTKLGYGIAKVDGKVLSLKCEKEMSGMAKKLKKFLQVENCRLNVVILDTKGNVLEEEIEDLGPDDDDDDVPDTNDTASPKPEPSVDHNAEALAKLKTFANALAPQIKSARADARPVLVDRFKKTLIALQEGDVKKAASGLDAIDKALKKLRAAPVPKPDGAPETKPSKSPETAKLEAASEILAERVNALQDSDAKSRLKKALEILGTHLQNGDLKEAKRTAKSIAEAIPKVAASQNSTPEAPVSRQTPETSQSYAIPEPELVNRSEDGKIWNAIRAELEPKVLKLLGLQYGDTGKMRAAWAYYIEKGNQALFSDAAKAVPGLRRLIEDAYKAQQSEAEKAVPSNVVAFVRARLDWSKTRTELDSEMIKLQNAILSVCQGEDFDGVANETVVLFDYLKALDGQLEEALDAIIGEADDTRREKLKLSARDVISKLHGALSQDFFADVDNSNGFADVKVRAMAVTALEEVDKILQLPPAA